jgi:hypothetical protein
MKTIKLLAVLFISTLVLTSCEDDHDHDHDHDDHEHEEINVLRYTLTNTTDANDVVIFEFNDPDGEGGQDGTPTTTGTLSANAIYSGELELLYNHDGVLEDVGAEIIAEDAEDHEVFYTSLVNGLSIQTTDVDGNGNPLGFETTVTASAAGTGTLTISIVHEGKKPNTGIDDALSGGGTTDIEVFFDITIQ